MRKNYEHIRSHYKQMSSKLLYPSSGYLFNMFENLSATSLHRFNYAIFCHKDSFSEIY